MYTFTIKKSNRKEYNYNFLSKIIIFLFLLIINPFIACFIAIFSLLRERNIVIECITIIMFLSLINITIDGRQTDYSWYIPLYSEAMQTKFSDYMLSLNNAKEPLYTLINYLICHILNGNRILFSIFSTFFFYTFMILAVNKICKYLELTNLEKGCCLCFLLFFPYIFANTANLLRQYYATGIILYGIVETLLGKKKYLIVVLSAIFIHTSSGLLVLLLLFKRILKKPLTLKITFLYGIICVIIKCLPLIAEYLLSFMGNSIFAYALTKASTETTFETVYTINKLIFAIGITLISSTIINYKYRDKKIIIVLSNLQIIFLFFIITNLNQAELCERMNIYIWCLLPLFFPAWIKFIKINKPICRLLSYTFFIFLILYQMYLTKYTYYCSDNFLFHSIFSYINNSHLYLL